MQTDEELIIAYKKGNKMAFKELIDRHVSPLYNYALRMGGVNDTADIVQEIFIKIWKNINRFDSTKASFKTWIFTIARNTVTDFLRKKKSILFSDLEKNNDKDVDSFEDNILSEDLLLDETLQKLEDSEFLNKILEKLRPNYREILILHYQEEMTFEEIGKILNKPLNTIKSIHRRAILELRKLIN